MQENVQNKISTNKEKVLAEYEEKRAEHILAVKSLLDSGYVFDARNIPAEIGYTTTLSLPSNDEKIKIIKHSRPISDEDLINAGREIGEQLELATGLSKENREKVNTRIWVVGDENIPLVNLIRGQGYQVRIFEDIKYLREISIEEFNCNLIIAENPADIGFYHLLDLPGRPIIFLCGENDVEENKRFFNSAKDVVVCVKHELLSKIKELT